MPRLRLAYSVSGHYRELIRDRMRGTRQGSLSLPCATPENKRFGTAGAESSSLAVFPCRFSLSGAFHDGVQRGDRKGASAAPSLQLQKGDSVEHKAFGRGMVLSVQKMGGDALMEIAFDNVGTKRLMLKSAAAHLTKVN